MFQYGNGRSNGLCESMETSPFYVWLPLLPVLAGGVFFVFCFLYVVVK